MRSQHAYIGVSSRTQCLVKEWCHCREDSQACPKTQAQDPVVLAFSNLQRAQVHFYCTCTNRFDLYHFYIMGLNTETSNRTCYKFLNKVFIIGNLFQSLFKWFWVFLGAGGRRGGGNWWTHPECWHYDHQKGWRGYNPELFKNKVHCTWMVLECWYTFKMQNLKFFILFCF